MFLPTCIVQLIKSFLPPPKPFSIIRQPSYYYLDYVATDNWEDVQDLRQYGDY